MSEDRDDLTADQKDAKARVETALARFQLGVDARKDQRARETAALEFQVPEKQWPEEVRAQRQGQLVAGIAVSARPMLSIPSLNQPIRLVLNSEKAAHLGVQVHAVSEEATDETAEVIQGLYRRIEVDSRASLARSWAFERGVKCGTGEYEVTTEYDPDGGSRFDQKIVIKRILHQGSVVRDPFAQEPDWSDGMWAFKTTDMAWDTYKQKYSKSKLKTYSDRELDNLSKDSPNWITGDGAGRAVRIAAYYEIRLSERTVVLLDDGSEAFTDEIPEGRTPLKGDRAKSRPCEERTLWYSIINAIEELEPAEEQDGRYIPLIHYPGEELIPFDGERRWQGIIEPNMDAARLINYGTSGLAEGSALETKAPYMLAEGQEEGHEQEFALANVRNFPYLRYRPTSLLGNLVPPPARTQADMSKMQMAALLIQQGQQAIHSGTGAFEAALGQASPQNKTKGGVLALQQQHEQGNSHFLDNLAEITEPYEAKVILDKIPYIYDRPGRIARILDKEDHPQTVMLNHAFTVDPKTKRPVKYQAPTNSDQLRQAPTNSGPPQPPGSILGLHGPQQPDQSEVKHYDLNKGRYGVTVSIGRSYQSRLEAGQSALGELFAKDPALMSIGGDIYFKFADFPGHMELSERMKKMLPPQLQDQNETNTAQQVGQLQAQVQQTGQQLQQAVEMLKTEKLKHDAQIEIEKTRAALAVELQKMKDATSLGVAWINAQTKGVLSAHEAQDEAIALGQQQAHEAQQAVNQQAHEVGLAAQAHAHNLEAGQQGALTDATQAAQEHGQGLEAGQAGHEQMMAQAQQAADLQPPDQGASA